LRQMGEMGIEALGYLSSGRVASPAWEAAQTQLLRQVEKPMDLTRSDVIIPMQMLVKAASGQTSAGAKH